MDTITKGLIGEQDFNHYDGINGTFSRKTSTGGTVTLSQVGSSVDVLLAYGNGTDYTDVSIQSAISYIGTTKKAVLILRPGSWTIGNNVNLPSNLSLRIIPGATVTVSSGYTFTLASAKQIDIGPYYVDVFAGSGSIAITGGDTYTASALTASVLQTLTAYVPDQGWDNIYYVSDYSSLAAAVTAIGSDSATLIINTAQTMTVNVTIPATTQTIITHAGLITTTGFTLQINGSFHAGLYRCFTGTGSVLFGEMTADCAHPEWWGLSESSTDAVNSAALLAAYNSLLPAIKLPVGTFGYDTGLVWSRAIRVFGGSSTGRNTGTGTSTTRLAYTGTGIALTLDGEGVNGTYNMHLSDFSILGNANADGGILIGTSTTTPVLMSSLKNINIDSFTKASAYGLKVVRCQQSVFENVHAHQNYYNFNINGLNTTLTFRNCHAISAASIGWYIAGLTGGSLQQCLSESNTDYGLFIYTDGVNSVNFFSWHSESNGVITKITGSGAVGSPTNVNFWGGYFGEDIANQTLELDYANSCTFHNVTVPGMDHVTVTDHTVMCVWETHVRTAVGTGITGNAQDRMNLIVPTYPT